LPASTICLTSAIVLIGGDKTGISGDRFYREHIPQAERILREYLAEIEEEDNGQS